MLTGDFSYVPCFPRSGKYMSVIKQGAYRRRTSIKHFKFTVLILFLILSLYGCKKKSDDSTGPFKVSFYYTPSGSSIQQGPIHETYYFHCSDPTDSNCNIFYFEDSPHQSGDWMAYPENKSNCSDFIAEVTLPDGIHFTFIGAVDNSIAAFRATGYYDKTIPGGGSEIGTFAASCDNIQAPSIRVICP